MNKYILTFCVLSTLLTACSDFEDINKNPNQPGVIPASSLMANIVYSVMGEDASDGSNNSTGMYSTFVGGDMGECWAQHWAKVQYNDEERYSARETALENFWQTMYQVCQNCKRMKELATDENNKNLQGVALTLQAYSFGVLTDCYGSIPYSEALTAADGNFKPKYDKQEDVYTGILALLDEAISLFGSNNGAIPADAKIMYGGSAAQWKKFATSLKFRTLMRISAKRNVSADLQALVNSGNLFSSNEDDAQVIFDEQPAANPVYETIIFGSRGEFKMNSVLVDMMTNLSDPRLPVFAKPAVSDGTYRGKPSGVKNVPNAQYGYKNISAIGDKYTAAKAPGVFLSYAEVSFLLAEAAQKGFISGSVETYYKNGIRASLVFNGIEDSKISTYLAQPNVQLNPGTELKTIGEQKWLALFGQGIESWIEWKRTKFPVLTPAIDATIDEIPSRYKYPSVEQSLNASSYSGVVTEQGPDVLSTKFWWLKP